MDKKIVQHIEKISVNSGVGRMTQMPNFSEKVLPEIQKEFAAITGQKPALRAAKQSIAGFKIREGVVVGMHATLRGKRMAAFLEKIIHVILPRVRDFRGINPNSIDEGGNLTIGLREHTIFPEINAEQSKFSFGLQITIVPKTEKNKDAALALYKEIGTPFEK